MWWRKPNVLGTPPAPRHGHSAHLVGDNYIVIGHSFFFLEILFAFFFFSFFSCHSLGGWGDLPGSKRCFFPIGSKTRYFDDIHILNTKTLTWIQIQPYNSVQRNLRFPYFCGHVGVVVDKKLYLTGGLNDCSQRTPNRKVHLLFVGPRRLEELCMEFICRHFEEYVQEIEEQKQKQVFLITADLEEKLKTYREQFFVM